MQAGTRLLSHGKQDPFYLFSAWYNKFYLCCFLVSTLSHVLFFLFFGLFICLHIDIYLHLNLFIYRTNQIL